MKIDKQIKENYPLKDLTTMKVGGPARFFVEIEKVEQLQDALRLAEDKKLALLILGGGSNIVVSDKGFDGLVIFIKILGWKIIAEDGKSVLIKVGAGEIWDEVVDRAIKHGWWGIENLSDIPGTAGAFVVQNAGAYGVEAEDVLESVEVWDIKNKQIKMLNRAACKFGYRQSVFKNEKKGAYVIVSINLRLATSGCVKADYQDVNKYLAKYNIKQPNLKQIREAIIDIRQSKLPDLKVDGNCGSMFLNSVLDEAEYEKLKKKIQKNFSAVEVNKLEYFKKIFWSKQGIKIPTAWLLDICGLKNARVGAAQVYGKWPLAIINKGWQAKAVDILELIKKVRQTVYQKTGMALQPEINLVGFSQEEIERYFKLN